MRQLLFKFAKENGVEIKSFRSERVDYSQVFYISVENALKNFADSYIVGEPSSKEWFINEAKNYILNGY